MVEYVPQPLTPAEADLKDFPYTPIYRSRLFGSAFHARATDAEWRAGVTLWLKSWEQVPSGSLPDDDVELCRLAELGRDLKTWKKLKAGAMRGWVKCTDGRLYHAVVAEVVLEAWGEKIEQRGRTLKARIAALEKRRLQAKEQHVKDDISAQLQKLRQELSQTAVTDELASVTEPRQNPVTETKGRKGKEREEISNGELTPPSSSPPAPPAHGPADAMTLAASLRDRLEAKLNLAVPVITAPIIAWLQAGATPELIEAVIDDVLRRKPEGWKPGGIGYFDKAVRQAIATGSAPDPAPDRPSGSSGYVPTRIETRDEIREQMRQRAITIKRGIHLAAVSNRDVLGMIKCGWLTQAEAEKAGYEP